MNASNPFALLALISLVSIHLSGATAETESSPLTAELARRIAELDADGDGNLSLAEVPDGETFEALDSDLDGLVTPAEAEAYYRDLLTSAIRAPGTPAAVDLIIVPDEGEMAVKRQVLDEIGAPAKGAGRPPNIVLIVADDLGYADTSVYGSTSIPTPHIDALAAGGIRFTDAYVTAASCSPTRAGLLTGRYQERFGFEFNTGPAAVTHAESRGLDPAAITLAEVLRQAGYATGAFGKWHLGTRDHFHPQERGFDEFFGFLAGQHSFFPEESEQPVYATVMRGRTPLREPEYLTDAFAREAVRFIDAHKNEPFFAYVPFSAVHTPIEASEKYLKRFPDESNPKQQRYNAMASALDDAVGDIVAALRRNGIDDDTLIIFLNDNGGPLYTGVQSNAPLRLGKFFLFEGGVRVPMILSWPGVLAPGSVYRNTVSSLDLFPTAIAAVGIRLPAEVDLDGVDLLPFLKEANGESPHQALFWRSGSNKAVRMGRWKLIAAGDHVWLFDLDEDIGETVNLAAERPEIAERLEQALKRWESEMKPPAWPSSPNRPTVDVDGVPVQLTM